MNKKKLFFTILGFVFLLPISVVNAQNTQLTSIANNVVWTLGTIATVLVVAGWIVAGILYLISGGSPEKTGTAKKAMWAAAIGTILVVIATGGYTVISAIINNIINNHI